MGRATRLGGKKMRRTAIALIVAFLLIPTTSPGQSARGSVCVAPVVVPLPPPRPDMFCRSGKFSLKIDNLKVVSWPDKESVRLLAWSCMIVIESWSIAIAIHNSLSPSDSMNTKLPNYVSFLTTDTERFNYGTPRALRGASASEPCTKRPSSISTLLIKRAA